jgi:hypothetical protein
MQQMDDVTGEPIRLSAHDREQWRRDTHQQIQHLIAANNALYARVVTLENAKTEFELEIKPAIWRELGLLDDKIVTLHCLPWFSRLRWLITGRI